MSVRDRLLARWPGRWQIGAPSHDDPAVALAEALASGRTPAAAIDHLIATGWFELADSLLQAELEPSLTDGERTGCLDLLVKTWARHRRAVADELDALELRARRAGGALAHDAIDTAATSVVAARAVLRPREREVAAIEARRRRELEAQAELLGLGPRLLHQIGRCLDARHWDAAARLLQTGPPLLVRAAPEPADVARPPDLRALGHPLALARELLDAPESLHGKYGLRVPDPHARELLEAVLSHDPAPAAIAWHLDLTLGGAPPAEWPDVNRFALTSTEILPVPRPAFARGHLVLAASGAVAGPTDAVIDVGSGRSPAGPHLGLPEILRVVTAEGDRRIAVLRVLGPQYAASHVLDDLADDVATSLDWAFDLATEGAQAPLVDVLLSRASGRPALVRVLFAAVLPDVGDRRRLVEDGDLDAALREPRTQELLADALLADLGGDTTAVRLLHALDQVGPPSPGDDVELVDYAVEALDLVGGAACDRVAIETAVARLSERRYIATAADGRIVLEDGTVRALAGAGIPR